MLKKFKQITKHLFRESSFYPAKELEVNQDTYQIRQLTTADIKDLLTVEREVYLGELPWTRSAFLSEFRSPLVHLYLGVFINEELVGFIGSRIIGTDCHITNIALMSRYQRKSIGSFLIDEIEKFAIMNRCETLSLEVRVGNRDAQKLYRKLGFQSRTIKKGYYTENNEDALDMVKILEKE
ncbi:ribosomal protein S18-alanine N-acetyltransferase [Enterococcus sp. C50]|uniref:ribosomal protein S18-alanine N-acetyltransferase n=1 Tax=Enterococcus sp. C50 TaxID=3231311 RepID=UPI00349FEB50